MRIRQLHVDGFGIWTDLELAELSEPLVVFYGENEAGKTTLMQFVRAVLYGFSAERRNRYLPPVHGGRPGGSLWVEDAHQSFVIQRHAARHSEEDQLEVSDSQGVRREGRPLALLLDGVDEVIFNNVFAFGLGEIQELATLTDSAAADLLYELTLGLDRVSLSDVMHELETSRRRLLAETNGSGQIAELVERKERLRAEIRDLATTTPRFLELVRQRQELDRTASELEAQELSLDERAQRLALAQQIEPRWRSRHDIDRQLDALGTVPHIADDCLPTLEDLKARAATRRNRSLQVTNRRKELIAEMGRLKVNDALCRQAPRLEALSEQQQWIASLDAQARQLEAELTEMTAEPHAAREHHDQASHRPAHGQRHANHDPKSGHERKSTHEPTHERRSVHDHKSAGEPKSADRTAGMERRHLQIEPGPVPAQPLSPHTIAALRAQGKSLSQLRRKVRKAHGDKKAARETVRDSHRKVADGLGAEKAESLSQSLERAGTLVSQLRRRVQIDERLDQLNRRRHELDEKSHESLDRQVPPLWQILSHGLFFAIGIAMLLASIFLPSPMLHNHGMAVGFLGLFAAGLGWVMTYASHHMSGQQFDDCQTRSDQLKEQTAAAEKERDELDKQLPKGGGPLVARLQAAEKEHARLEQLMPLDSHREHGVRSYKAAREEHRSIDRDYKKALHRWRAALEQAGLPANLTPRTLRATIERGRQLQTLNRRLEERRAQLVDCRRQHEILAERILQVAVDSRIEFDESDPLALLREMLRQLQDEQLRVHARDQLKAGLVRLRRVRRKLARQVANVNQRLEDLIRSSGSRDEEDLRRRLGIQAEARRLERARELIEDEITAALAGHEQVHEISACLDDCLQHGHDMRKQMDEVSADKHALRIRLGHVWEERGALLEQVKSQSGDRKLAAKRLELSQVKDSLRKALHRWQVLCTCSTAIESVREVYERQRQPEVLREASEYFSKLTGGRYTRAWSSLGHRVLWVDDADGKPLSVDKLSRGTREQLFLSLRLALVSAYARRGVRLPIVMDDVLVNFDVPRVKAAVEVLRDFVRAGHQILVFTCHEHIASLFRRARVEVRSLPGNFLRIETLPEPEPPPRVVPPPHFLPTPAFEPPREEELTLAEIDDEPPPRLAHLEPLPGEPLPVEPVQVVATIPRPAIPRPGRAARPRRPRPVAEPAAVVPPRPREKVRREQWVDRVPWSAEEFDGELADRVRRSEPIVEYYEEPARPTGPVAQDEELLDVQFEDDSHHGEPRSYGRNGHHGR